MNQSCEIRLVKLSQHPDTISPGVPTMKAGRLPRSVANDASAMQPGKGHRAHPVQRIAKKGSPSCHPIRPIGSQPFHWPAPSKERCDCVQRAGASLEYASHIIPNSCHIRLTAFVKRSEGMIDAVAGLDSPAPCTPYVLQLSRDRQVGMHDWRMVMQPRLHQGSNYRPNDPGD